MNFGSRYCDVILALNRQSSEVARYVQRITYSPSNDRCIAKRDYVLSRIIQCPAAYRDMESMSTHNATSIQDIFRDTYQASLEATTTCGPVDSTLTLPVTDAVDSVDPDACQIRAVDGRVVDHHFPHNPAVCRIAQTQTPTYETHSAGEGAADKDATRDFQVCHRTLVGMVDRDRRLISFRH